MGFPFFVDRTMNLRRKPAVDHEGGCRDIGGHFRSVRNRFEQISAAVILRCSPALGRTSKDGSERKRRSFETPRKRAAPQDDG
jgi:hypothetical protein